MANKDYKKEPKAHRVAPIGLGNPTRMAAASIERGDLKAFASACKAIANSGSLASRGGWGKFWRDNADPALLAARDLSSRRWLSMPLAWSQAPAAEKAWLLPRMLFCAAKASSQSRLTQAGETPGQESSDLRHLLMFAKKALSDMEWAMDEADLAIWTRRGIEHGSPAASWALIESMHGRISQGAERALAAKALAGCLRQGASLQVCKSLARISGGVIEAEKTLARLDTASSGEGMMRDPESTLDNRVRGHEEQFPRNEGLIHAALDSGDKNGGWADNHILHAISAIKWLSSEGAQMDRLSNVKKRAEPNLLCPLGRACTFRHPFAMVQALLEAGFDPGGAENCSRPPLSVLCSHTSTSSKGYAEHAEGALGPDTSELKALDALLSGGAPVDRLGPLGESALHVAASAARFDFFERLAAMGADVSKKDFEGRDWSSWALASQHAHSSMPRMNIWGSFMARAEALELSFVTKEPKGKSVDKPARL